MFESFSDAIEECKMVDHLIFVSLKYTRTVDVIINIIKRMIDCIDFLIDVHLKKAVEKGIIKEKVPKNQALKTELLKETYPNNTQINEMADFYLKLRKIIRNVKKKNYGKEKEFKRHVALITELKDKQGTEEIRIGIDELEEYHKTRLRKYMDYAKEEIKNSSK